MCQAGDVSSIPGFGRSSGRGTLQYSCLGKIPWTEQPSGLQSMSHKELDTAEHELPLATEKQ